MAGSNDVLSQLLPASWKTIPFPVTSWDVSWSHDRGEHKVYKKPVSNIELTGRNSREFSFDIPFRNGVIPGPTEDELRGRVLFPDLCLAFIDAFNEDTAGDLVHPFHGKINCKPHTIQLIGRGENRDGIEVRATFTESDDTAEGTAPQPDTPSAAAGLASDAESLDAELGALDPPIEPTDGVPFTSFSQLAALVRAPFDTASMLSARITNANAALAGELDRLKESVDRLNDVNLWPVDDLITKLRNSLADINQQANSGTAKMLKYRVPRDMTVGQIAILLSVSFDDLLMSNPFITDKPLVPTGTIVIYARK